MTRRSHPLLRVRQRSGNDDLILSLHFIMLLRRSRCLVLNSRVIFFPRNVSLHFGLDFHEFLAFDHHFVTPKRGYPHHATVTDAARFLEEFKC